MSGWTPARDRASGASSGRCGTVRASACKRSAAGSAPEQAIAHSGIAPVVSAFPLLSGQCSVGIAAVAPWCAAADAGAAAIDSGATRSATSASKLHSFNIAPR